MEYIAERVAELLRKMDRKTACLNLVVTRLGADHFFFQKEVVRLLAVAPGDPVVIRKQDTADVGDIVVAPDDENRNTLKTKIKKKNLLGDVKEGPPFPADIPPEM